ncbi:MAG: flagellar motor switch protein FliM [Firmicutes bacterium]|nr:flagellar motor switch protein FliM [Bacillota bacterium]
MSEILSQAEIDALLSALSTGTVSAEELKQEEQKKKVRVYDFRRPNKFSKDQIHTLRVIYENYGRSLSTYLSALLRTVVHVNVLSVEQLTYEEFAKSLPNPSIVNIFTMEPLDGNGILEINPTIAFTVIDRLFGGPGRPPDKIRALTEIERTVIERIVQKMLDLFREPWETFIKISPHLEMIESNPQFAQIVSQTEMVVLISLECKIGEQIGMINICIPFLVLEPIVSKLSVHFWFSSSAKERTREHIESLRQQIERTSVPVTVILGRAKISVGELLDLQVGDVIPLERKISEDLEILIGKRPKFFGQPGIVGHKMAIQIRTVIDQGDDEDE